MTVAMKKLIFMNLIVLCSNLLSSDPSGHDRVETEMERIRWFVSHDKPVACVRGRLYQIYDSERGCCAAIYRWAAGITKEQHHQAVLGKYYRVFDDIIEADWCSPRARQYWLHSMTEYAERLQLVVPDEFKKTVNNNFENDRVFISDRETKDQLRILKNTVQGQILNPDMPLL